MSAFSWQRFPAWLIGSMVGVAVVNGYMVYAAVHSFPGEAGTDGFDLSNSYARVLKAEAEQAALGWHVETAVDPQRHPLLTVTDRDGKALAAAQIDLQAERPVGPKDHTVLAIRDLGEGHLKAETTLFSGQWDLLVTIREGSDVYSTTRRI